MNFRGMSSNFGQHATNLIFEYNWLHNCFPNRGPPLDFFQFPDRAHRSEAINLVEALAMRLEPKPKSGCLGGLPSTGMWTVRFSAVWMSYIWRMTIKNSNPTIMVSFQEPAYYPMNPTLSRRQRSHLQIPPRLPKAHSCRSLTAIPTSQ